jgi:hypothetical protein
MDTIVAASCPISYGGVTPGKRVLHGDPWSRPGHLQDLVNKIPRAHDLPSAINALNIMNNIITMINRAEPVVNNTHVPGQPSVILKGETIGEQFGPADWVYEGREYLKQKLINPDNNDQYIEINCLKVVYFFNENTSYRLNYEGEGSGRRMPGVAGD